MKSPNALLETLALAWVNRRDRDMMARADGNRKLARRTVILIPFRLFVGMTLLASVLWLSDSSVLRSIAIMGIALIVGYTFPMAGLERQQAYSRGWWNGRQRAFESLREAQQRGYSTDDWLTGELERDMRQIW